jgi:hypothetical protein
MKITIDSKSMLFGIIVLVTIGAAPSHPFVKEIQSVRFLVLEVTPKEGATSIGRPVVLRLSPHYGKISKQGLDFRFKNETQELSLVTYIEKGYEIKRGDILGFQVSQHLKLSPGSRVVRHLPSGGAELVP